MAGKLRIQFQMGFFKAASTFYIQIAPDPRSQIAPTSNPWRSRRLCYHGSIALICRFHTVEACRKSHDVRLSPAFRWWKSLKIHRNEKTGWDEENNLGFIKQLFIAEKSGFCSIYSNTQLIERAFLNFMIQPLRVHWGQVVGKLGRNLIKRCRDWNRLHKFLQPTQTSEILAQLQLNSQRTPYSVLLLYFIPLFPLKLNSLQTKPAPAVAHLLEQQHLESYPAQGAEDDTHTLRRASYS